MIDSSAALGVVGRRGAGKLRHVRVGQFWVQEASESGNLRYRKVKGTDNPADLPTKALTGGDINRYMSAVVWSPELAEPIKVWRCVVGEKHPLIPTTILKPHFRMDCFGTREISSFESVVELSLYDRRRSVIQ